MSAVPPFAPRYDVRVSGISLSSDLSTNILSLVVQTDLDLAGSFTMTVRNADNRLLDSPLMDLGKTVEIHLGYGNELVPAFLGEVAAIEPSFPRDGAPTIQVTGYDRSYRMRRDGPPATTFPAMNDSLIAARIALENGLVPIVDPAPGAAREVTQTENDMAFLKSLAKRHFFDVYVEWDRLHFGFPRPQLAAHVLEWGQNLSSFSPRISAAGLAGLQVVRGYNQELAQSIYVAAVAADFDLDNLVERLGSAALDLLTALARQGVRQERITNPADAKELAWSLLADLMEGMYEGSGNCIGIPDLAAGKYVAIQGVGRRFSGTYRVRSVTHRIDGSGFWTDFSISQGGDTSLVGRLRKNVVAAPAPDQPAKFFGVVLAVVVDINEEHNTGLPTPIPAGRIQVTFPSFSDRDQPLTLWAPCARPMAGNGQGFFAQPEVNDQVLVAFEQGDLDAPYVLGALWSARQPPPVRDSTGANNLKLIRSRAGQTITFDDTAGAEAVMIEDGSGSSIRLNASDGSIAIKARGDLTISAAGQLRLEAAAGQTSLTLTQTAVNVQ